MTTTPRLLEPDLPHWMETICEKAGPRVLELAEWFLYAGLAFGIATAIAEALAAFRGRTADTPAADRAGLTGVQAIIAALTSLLQALRDARAWLALVIFGLVLLVIGASAPDLCVPEEYRPKVQQQQQQQTRGGSGGTSGGQTSRRSSGETDGQAGGRAQSPAPPRSDG